MEAIFSNISGQSQTAPAYPFTFRLPSLGERDPLFGLPRAKYYALEAEGRIRLLRLRDKGKSRGTTLVPVSEMLRILQEDATAERPVEAVEQNRSRARKSRKSQR